MIRSKTRAAGVLVLPSEEYAKLSDILVKLFNIIEEAAYYPTTWRDNFLVPLHKKGNKSDPNN